MLVFIIYFKFIIRNKFSLHNFCPELIIINTTAADLRFLPFLSFHKTIHLKSKTCILFCSVIAVFTSENKTNSLKENLKKFISSLLCPENPVRTWLYGFSPIKHPSTSHHARTHYNGNRRHMVHVIVPLCSQSIGKHHNQHTVNYLECSRLAKEGCRETVTWTDNHRKYKKQTKYITQCIRRWCVVHVFQCLASFIFVDLFWLDMLLAFRSSSRAHCAMHTSMHVDDNWLWLMTIDTV